MRRSRSRGLSMVELLVGTAVGLVVGAVVEVRHLDEEVLAVRVLANDEVVAHTILQTQLERPDRRGGEPRFDRLDAIRGW